MNASKLWPLLAAGLIATLSAAFGAESATKRGTVVTERISSLHLRGTRTGLNPERTVKVYLPPGYADSGRAYPVVYYCHNLNWSAEQMFADGNLERLIERGFANGVVKEFILVAADYSSPAMGSWYENSATTGRWLDFTVEELVPFIDGKFRTIRQRESRGVVGDFVGGRGALVLAMLHPDIFNAVYALHPVATGTGWVPMASRPNWNNVHQAKSFDELDANGYARPFVSIFQAFLPNPDRPPFYCDFMVELENGQPKLHAANAKKLREAFLLDHMLEERADNLRKLGGLAFDWARYDPNQDHVYSNHVFTRRLDELGIEHEAEEYRGDPWNKNWTENGRFYARVLPFLNQHLAFKQ